MSNFGFKIKKDDENAIKDAEKEISRLAQQLAEVEQRMDSDMEKHKKEPRVPPAGSGGAAPMPNGFPPPDIFLRAD